MSAGPDVLVLFGREPRAGAVKTRLVPPLTAEQAADLYSAFLGDVAERPRAGAVHFFVAPPADRERVRSLVPRGMPIALQRGAGLGERLVNAMDELFAAGFRRVVVRNTDSPLLPLEREREAFAALAAGAEIVLGPDRGGGYYLVGCCRPFPALFLDLPMSVPSNFHRTLLRAGNLSDRVATLPAEDDVDVGADVERLAETLARDAGARAFAPRTAAAVARLVAAGRIRAGSAA